MKKIIVTTAIAALVSLPFAATAHEHQAFIINGVEYEFTVGSLNEPVTVDDKTGVDLRVAKVGPAHHDDAADDHEAGMPVSGLEETLKVELIAGDRKKIQELSPVYNTPGAYKTSFYATVATTLSYRVFGDLEGTPIDLTFTCTPAGHDRAPEDKTEVKISNEVTRILKTGGFGCPTEKADMGFPENSASVIELQKKSGESGMISWGAGALALAALAVAFIRRRS